MLGLGEGKLLLGRVLLERLLVRLRCHGLLQRRDAFAVHQKVEHGLPSYVFHGLLVGNHSHVVAIHLTEHGNENKVK